MNPNDILVDREFEQFIRPLSNEERTELKESLSSAGLLSPLIVWKHEGQTILVDGHNRLALWKQFQGFNEDYEFKVQELYFGNRDDVKEWIIKNQLGRRNLSPDDYKLLVGQLYNARKKASNDGGKGTRKATVGQNDQRFTAEQIALETGVSPKTVRRAASLASKVEEIQAAQPDAPREAVIAQAKEMVAPKPNPEPERRPLDELLERRWQSFIRDIPVTDHTAVRLWLSVKLKEAAL